MALDLVLFVPAARPRLRTAAPVASIEDRVAMVQAAIEGLPWAKVSLVDAVRPGPAYTVDTLRDIRRDFPSAALFLVVGADSLRSLPEWKDVGDLEKLATVVCVGRPGGARPEDMPEGHPGHRARYVEGAMIALSATDVRRRVEAGEPVIGMVPDAVASYIQLHGLYR
jgi:nicotinate-nucleotide adenylyltransferase